MINRYVEVSNHHPVTNDNLPPPTLTPTIHKPMSSQPPTPHNVSSPIELVMAISQSYISETWAVGKQTAPAILKALDDIASRSILAVLIPP